MSTPVSNAIPPNTWHPDVPRAASIERWLERGPGMAMNIPILPPHPFEATEAVPDMMTISLHRAWGAAPYVGRPFVYTWWVGDAGWGRFISSGAHIAYLPPDFEHGDPILWRCGGEPADDSEGWRP